MTLTLSWIDHDQQARDRMERILALFEERDTRDELGSARFVIPSRIFSSRARAPSRPGCATSSLCRGSIAAWKKTEFQAATFPGGLEISSSISARSSWQTANTKACSGPSLGADSSDFLVLCIGLGLELGDCSCLTVPKVDTTEPWMRSTDIDSWPKGETRDRSPQLIGPLPGTGGSPIPLPTSRTASISLSPQTKRHISRIA